MKGYLSIVLMLLGAMPASAVQFPDQSRVHATGSAAQLLALQREGKLASSNPQAVTDLEREKAVDRFLKTYNNAIPGASSGGGTSSASSGQ